MRIGYFWGGLAGAGLIVAAAALGVAIAPGWALTALATQGQAGRGWPLQAASVHLDMSDGIAVRFDGVTLAGASGDDGALLKASSFRLPIGLGGLLGHRASFSGGELQDATLNFTIDEMGHANWPQLSPGAGRVLFDNATLAFSDARTGQRFQLSRISGAVDVSEAGETSASGTAIANGALLKIDAFVKDMARLTSGGSPAEFTLAGPAFNLSFTGRVATVGALSLAGTAAISGPDARQALAWTGASLPGDQGFKAFSMSGGLDASGRVFALRNADLRLDAVVAKGDIGIDYRGTVPKLTAALKTSPLRLDGYMPALTFEGQEWSAAPVGFEGLRGLDASLHLEVAGLSSGRLDLGGAVIEANLAKGRLDGSVSAATLPDCKFTLDGSGGVQGMAIGLRSVDPIGLLGAVAHVDWLSGAGTLTASLQATGASLQEMVSTLAGDAQFQLSDGALHHLDVAKVLAAVSRDVLQGWPGAEEDHSAFTGLSGTLHFADGIGALKAFKLDGPAVTMTATGSIDLLRRAIDLRADPRLFTGSGSDTVGLPVAVVVRGSWDKPKVYPDIANILSNPGAAYADLKGLGMPQLPAGGN